MIVASCSLDGRSGHDAAWQLLAQTYQTHMGTPLPPVMRQAGGKPCFVDSPWHFSLSHTPRHAFVALSEYPVGIDAEELDRTVSPGLARRVLSEYEYAQYQAAPDPNRALLTFWVLKEAQVKCTGQGLRGFPNRTQFDLNDPRVAICRGCLTAVIEEKGESK